MLSHENVEIIIITIDDGSRDIYCASFLYLPKKKMRKKRRKKKHRRKRRINRWYIRPRPRHTKRTRRVGGGEREKIKKKVSTETEEITNLSFVK